MTIYLTAEKVTLVQKICRTLLQRQTYSIRDVAQVIGKIVSTFSGVMHVPLFYRAQEKDKTIALRKKTKVHLTGLRPFLYLQKMN